MTGFALGGFVAILLWVGAMVGLIAHLIRRRNVQKLRAGWALHDAAENTDDFEEMLDRLDENPHVTLQEAEEKQP